MNEKDKERMNTIRTGIAILLILEAIVFFVAALLHLGIALPVGFREPRIIPAAIVEGLIGVFFAVGAYAVLSRKSWAWAAALGSHAFAVAGILLGMVALAMGLGPRTEANDIYHRVTLVVAILALIVLATPLFRRALKGDLAQEA